MVYAQVNDLTMYYEDAGLRDGFPVVLLHGFTQTGADWMPQISALAPHYRVLIPDLRGHGLTNNPGGLDAMNHRQFARDIITFCETLGVRRAIFCGESTGAMLLLTLGLAEPDLAHAFVLAGGTYYYSDDLRAWWKRQTPETIVSDIEAAQKRHVALGSEHWRTVAEAFIALGTHAHTEDFPDPMELAEIRTPSLIVHGDRDGFFPVSVPVQLAQLLSDTELCILPSTGHVPPTERPDWFNAIVLDFLARHPV